MKSTQPRKQMKNKKIEINNNYKRRAFHLTNGTNHYASSFSAPAPAPAPALSTPSIFSPWIFLQTLTKILASFCLFIFSTISLDSIYFFFRFSHMWVLSRRTEDRRSVCEAAVGGQTRVRYIECFHRHFVQFSFTFDSLGFGLIELI